MLSRTRDAIIEIKAGAINANRGCHHVKWKNPIIMNTKKAKKPIPPEIARAFLIAKEEPLNLLPK